MAAYVIANIDVHDPALYEEYRRLTPATLEQYGGKFLVRGGAHETLEGGWQPKRLVVIEFESVEAARRWYDSEEYRDLKARRKRATTSEVLRVEGV
jgi:uncharacterized protein (DUF1330 family)